MPVGPGPRFAIEAVFIVAVAAIAAFSKLSTVGIILSIGAAWVLVAAVEWAASRRQPAPVDAERLEQTPVSEEPRQPPLFRRLRERAQHPVAPAVEPAEAQHVRVLPRDAEPVAATPAEADAAAVRPLAEPVDQ